MIHGSGVRPTPKTLTDAEVRTLLSVTGRAERDLRDHILLLLALNTGLRVSELTGLNVGDVRSSKGVRTIVPLRPETTKGHKEGAVTLPESTRRKLVTFLAWKEKCGEPTTDDAPLFVSRGGGRGGGKAGARVSVRTAEHLFATWQTRAGFDRHVHFHMLRHTYGTRLLRQTGNLRIVQEAMRHSSPATTSIYTHPSTEDLVQAAESLGW